MRTKKFNPKERYYPVKKIADLLSVKPDTVLSWAKQGKIKIIRVNSEIRISESEYQKIIKNG